MSNPNTAEEIYSKHGIKAYEKIGISEEWMQPPEWVVEAMQEHTAQTLDRLKGEAIRWQYDNKSKVYNRGYNEGIEKVIQLIEEVSDDG